jgi:hypothetical protein
MVERVERSGPHLKRGRIASGGAHRADPADGVVRVPLWTGPGIGVEPEPALLKQYTLQRAALFS